MKNLLKLPKQEDVTEIDMGGGNHIKAVTLTDDNRPAVLEIVQSMYCDDVCMYCKRSFTMDEVKRSIWAHNNPHGRIVHRECWNKNNPNDRK